MKGYRSSSRPRKAHNTKKIQKDLQASLKGTPTDHPSRSSTFEKAGWVAFGILLSGLITEPLKIGAVETQKMAIQAAAPTMGKILEYFEKPDIIEVRSPHAKEASAIQNILHSPTPKELKEPSQNLDPEAQKDWETIQEALDLLMSETVSPKEKPPTQELAKAIECLQNPTETSLLQEATALLKTKTPGKTQSGPEIGV